MNRLFLIAVASLALTGLVFGQAPPAAGAAPGPGRGALAPVVIGPAAPVPPEVAIPRPTPQELARLVASEHARWSQVAQGLKFD